MARVLVIEDEGIVRVMLRTMLQTAGHEVFEARDGEEGLQVYRQNLPDLVVTDLLMSGLGGIEMIEEMRKDCPDIKIIVLTGHLRTIASEIERLNVGHVFEKPIHMPDLLDVMTDLLGDR